MSEKIIEENNACEVTVLPMLSLRGIVLFPKMLLHFEVGRKKSILALQSAMNKNQKVFLVTQKDITVEDPGADEHYKIGVVATIKQIVKGQNNSFRVVVSGDYRAKLISVVSELPFFKAGILRYDIKFNSKKTTDYETALTRKVVELFSEYAALNPQMPKEFQVNVATHDSPLYICEYISENINVGYQYKQDILSLNSVSKRLEYLINLLEKEISVLKLEEDINKRVKFNLDKNQRDYYLREQLRVISEELDDDSPEEEEDSYKRRIEASGLDTESCDKLMKEVVKLRKMPSNSNDSAVIRTYLDTVLALPFGAMSKENKDLERAKKILDRDHYGLCDVKQRILEFLAARKLAEGEESQIICLVGPPGVGKTSVAKSIAHATGRKYERISLGGVRDESDIRGHRKTYIGAMPGRIIDAFLRAKTSNPLILLDEIDKMGNDYRGDPASAMLEVLDGEQNKNFVDHYIEIPFDLSKALFITTANSVETIPAPLFDRMEIIELSSYTPTEKFEIAKNYLVTKQISKNGLSKRQLKLDDDALKIIISSYTRESGVRELEREIASVCRKTALSIVTGETAKIHLTEGNVEEMLGNKKYFQRDCPCSDEVGCVKGLAFTQCGGVLLPIEVSAFDGDGKLELTGSLGEVMKESARTAISYVRSIAEKYGIPSDFYKTKDIHIHAPEGAVPKDGPSAGVTITTALVSALSGIPVRHDIAMTGEVTLHGKVLAIGGLKEKTTAALTNGIKTVIVPLENAPDISKLGSEIKDSIDFVYVNKVETVLEIALGTSDAGSGIRIKTISNSYKKSSRTGEATQ